MQYSKQQWCRYIVYCWYATKRLWLFYYDGTCCQVIALCVILFALCIATLSLFTFSVYNNSSTMQYYIKVSTQWHELYLRWSSIYIYIWVILRYTQELNSSICITLHWELNTDNICTQICFYRIFGWAHSYRALVKCHGSLRFNVSL